MIKIILSAVFFCFLAVTVPISYGADVCERLEKTACCGQKNTTDNTTKLCQFVVCNGTGACKAAGVAQTCPNATGTAVPSPDTCTNATGSTTAASPSTTTQKNVTKPSTTAAPSTTQTQDVCTGKDQNACCNFRDAQNKTQCQFMLCTGNTTGACYNKTTPVADICGAAPATGVDKCATTTPAPSTTAASTNKSTTAPTTQAPTTHATPKCEDKTDNRTCCGFKIANVSCQWVNCTDKTNPTQVHNGCHSVSDDLTNVCVKDTNTNLCGGSTTPSPATTPAPNPSTTKPAPTGGAQPATGGNDQGRHFDGASFIGGIVLCAGLVAIGFFGLKFYRARTERNYHTLH